MIVADEQARALVPSFLRISLHLLGRSRVVKGFYFRRTVEAGETLGMAILQAILHENVREGELHEKLDRNWVRCFACGHRCPIPDGQAGVCKVRYNRGGTLYVPWGYVGGVQCDPIEKKPFHHAYPGSLAYSFGMLGCDLHCGYCQNWVTSQALRDPNAASPPMRVTPDDLVRDALDQGAKVIVSTYNEPLITSEWAVAIFKQAKAAGLVTGFVSNGNGTPQVLGYLRPWVDLYKVDLKSFDDRHYRQLGGRIEPILQTIRCLHAMRFWVEIVTLVHSGIQRFRRRTQTAGGVLGERLTGYSLARHRLSQRLQDDRPRQYPPPRPWCEQPKLARLRGLRYVYAGNLPGQVGDLGEYALPRVP